MTHPRVISNLSVKSELSMHVFHTMKKNGHKFCPFPSSALEYAKCPGVKIMAHHMVIWSFCVERKTSNVPPEKPEGNH